MDSETFKLMGEYRTSIFKICAWIQIKVRLSLVTHTIDYACIFPGKEHALIMPNHRSDIDWLVGWVLAQVYHLLFATIQLLCTCKVILANCCFHPYYIFIALCTNF